jgi:hypothetical protein
MASSSRGRQTRRIRQGLEDCLDRGLSSPLEGRLAKRIFVRARQSTRGLVSGLGVGGCSSRSPPAERSADERLSPQHGSSRSIGSRRSSRRRRIDASGGRRLVVAPSKSRSARPRVVTATHPRLRGLSRCGCLAQSGAAVLGGYQRTAPDGLIIHRGDDEHQYANKRQDDDRNDDKYGAH